MFNKDKVRKLLLTAHADQYIECARRIRGSDDCQTYCSSCAFSKSEKHYKYINEEKNFDCSDCAFVKDYLKIGNTNNCTECKKIIIKHITDGYKGIFNSLKREETK